MLPCGYLKSGNLSPLCVQTNKFITFLAMSARSLELYSSLTTIYFIASAFVSFYLGRFFWHQGRTSGWTKAAIFENKFFAITAIASIAQAINLIIHAVEMLYFVSGYSRDAWNALNIFGNLLLDTSACCHVVLVYLRSAVILQKDQRHVVALKLLVALCFSSTISAGLLDGFSFYFPNSTLSGVDSAFNIISGVLLLSIDAISTFKFAKTIQNIHESIAVSGKAFQSVDFRAKQTSFVAQRGIAICLSSFVAVVLITISSVAFSTESSGQHSVRVIFYLALSAICILWMDLKVKVDEISTASAQSSPTSRSTGNNEKRQETYSKKQESQHSQEPLGEVVTIAST
jgi:hypothetical protein